MSATPEMASHPTTRSRWRFELIFASVCIGFGLLAFPALIYWIGALVLGAYGENAGLGTFYLDFFRDLAEPSARTWALLLGPFLTLTLLRLVLRVRRSTPADSDTPPPEPPPPTNRRVEPRLGAD